MRTLAAPLLLAALSLVAGACGGEDTFPRDEFVRQVTAGGVTKDVANCTYDGIRKDKKVMADLIKADGPTDEISVTTDQTLSKVIARCLLESDTTGDSTSKDTEKSTTTTEKRR